MKKILLLLLLFPSISNAQTCQDRWNDIVNKTNAIQANKKVTSAQINALKTSETNFKNANCIIPSPTNPTLATSSSSVNAGNSITVSWNNISNPTNRDWISLYPNSSTPNNQFGSWIYTSSCSQTLGTVGNSSGSCSFLIPLSIIPGNTYEFRLLANDGYTLIVKSMSFDISAPENSPPSGSLGITLQLQSGNLSFNQDNAIDVGDYNGTFVHQHAFKQRIGDWTVFFRPDVDGNRDEIVVELGTIRSNNPSHLLSPYTAIITKNGSTLATINVPKHFWWSRWRWQSSPRPFVRTATELIQMKAVPSFTTSYLYGYTGWSNTYTYSPMGTGNLQTGQGTPGDRPELGIATLPQADFLLFGTPAAKDSMIAQAEAAASMPLHCRDELTNTFFDVQANPYYALIFTNGTTNIISNPSVPNDDDYFRLQASHMPSLDFIPFMLTDDPYYLEEVQAAALYHIVESWYHTSLQQLPGLAQPNESRNFAWGVRTIAQASYATPNSVPSWLNPKSYWLQNLADNRTYLQRFQDSPARVHSYFHTFTRSDFQGSFIQDYMALSLAYVVRLGFPEWDGGYQWFMEGLIPFVSDIFGWKKGWPDPYYTAPLGDTAPPSLLIPDTSQDGNTLASWSALFNAYCAIGGNTSDPSLHNCPNPPWDGSSINQVQSSAGYFFWRAAVLHMAVGLNVPGASEASQWLDSQIPSTIQRLGGSNDPRFSIDSN